MQHNAIEKIKKGSGMTRIHQQAGPTSTSELVKANVPNVHDVVDELLSIGARCSSWIFVLPPRRKEPLVEDFSSLDGLPWRDYVNRALGTDVGWKVSTTII